MQTLQKHTILLTTILLWSCISVFAADKYNCKELDTEDGLNLYDYGARHYDAALCRWNAVAAFGVWGGPIGWGVSGAYFLVDVCGGWDCIYNAIKED